MLLQIATWVVSVCICVIVFVLQIQDDRQVEVVKKESKIMGFLKKSNIRALDYDATNVFLKRNGLLEAYSFMNPFSYTLCRLFFGVVLTAIMYFVLVSFEFEYPLVSLLLLPCGFWLSNKIVLWMNSIDNDEMLADIRRLYDTLRLQAKAGMYLTESLMEAYRVVSTKRLKKALLELNANISMNHQIIDGIDEFASKFNNEYINMLCITIKQAEKSGQSVKILNDISSQLVSVEKQMHKKEEKSLEHKLLIMLLMLFGTIILITIAMFAEVLSTSMKF